MHGDGVAGAGGIDAFVGFPFDAHVGELKSESGGEHSPHGIAVSRDLRPLGDNTHVGIDDAPPQCADMRDGDAQHLDRVPTAIPRIAIGEHLPYVPRGRRTEQRIGDGVCNRVAVGVAGQVHVAGNIDTTEAQRPSRSEAVGVIADAGARAHDERFRIRIASAAAFFALSMPTVPTGTPLGSWAIANSASRPLRGPEANGTPITGRSVSAGKRRR